MAQHARLVWFKAKMTLPNYPEHDALGRVAKIHNMTLLKVAQVGDSNYFQYLLGGDTADALSFAKHIMANSEIEVLGEFNHYSPVALQDLP